MPTLVAAFTLVGLLKMAYVDMPRWHLAFWFAAIVGITLRGAGVPGMQLVWNILGSFVGAWLYFLALDRTDNCVDRVVHYLILVAGMGLLLFTRFWLDVRYYSIGL